MKRSFLSTALSLLVATTLAAQAAPAKAAAQAPVKPKPVQAAVAKPATAAAAATMPVAMKKDSTHARRADGTTVTTDQIKQTQQALADKGLYKGKVSGRLNGDFRKAVKAFQTQNQLKVTGRLNQETLAKLNIH